MIRVAFLTLTVAAAPALALAQGAAPAPPAPAAAPAPSALPAPAAAPAPPAGFPLPVAPVPPVPPMPFAIAAPDVFYVARDFADEFTQHFDDFDVDLDVDFDFAPFAGAAGQVAQLAATDMAQRAEVAVAAARQAADQARAVRFTGDAYNGGLNALQQGQYERAIEAFNRVIQANGTRADAALYWKSFTEFRLARTAAALQTIGQLQKTHPQSRYLSDARVLETEVRKQSGQNVDPAQVADDEIKLLAIQGLERTDEVVPLLEGVLNGANSLNVKRRALYVLALRPDARAREILLNYAKGAGNPDLQLEGVRLLVSRRDVQTTDAVLRDLYASSGDVAIRRAVIDAYRGRARGRDGAASSAATAQELVMLYQRETDADLRRQIVGVLVSIDAMDQVGTLIRAEKDPQLRSRVIGAMAGHRGQATTQALMAMYPTFTDTPSREAIINGLAHLQSAEALISLARTESDAALKMRIVRHLSEMASRSKPAADYLMEVIR